MLESCVNPISKIFDTRKYINCCSKASISKGICLWKDLSKQSVIYLC